mgnify:FL=1
MIGFGEMAGSMFVILVGGLISLWMLEVMS